MVFRSKSNNTKKIVRARSRELKGLSHIYRIDRDSPQKAKKIILEGRNSDPVCECPFIEEDNETNNIIINKNNLITFIEKKLKCNFCSSSVSIETETIGIATLIFVIVIMKKKSIHTCCFQNTRV